MGVIICKRDRHRSGTERGYIAMLAIHKSMRKRGMGSRLVKLAAYAMDKSGCDEAVLETEVTNLGALRLYEVCKVPNPISARIVDTFCRAHLPFSVCLVFKFYCSLPCTPLCARILTP